MFTPEGFKGLFSASRVSQFHHRVDDYADIMEYGDLGQDEVIQIVECARDQAIIENDFLVKESLFHLMLNAAVFQNIARYINWQTIAETIYELDEEILGYALKLLGFSKNLDYIPLIEKYIVSPNECICQTASEALIEITYKV